jgi:hypothetical protein
MTVTLRLVVETCCACPNQWDAWTVDGQYLACQLCSRIML